MRKRLITVGILGSMILLGYLAAVQAGVQVNSSTDHSLEPVRLPQVIWVEDFDLEAGDIEQNQGILGGDGPLKRMTASRRGGLLNRRNDPSETALKLKGLLSESLTKELVNNGLPAKKLPSGVTSSGRGWLIKGQFLEVDEGNRLRRATIGFGSGATHMQIECRVYNLETYPDTPFLILGTGAGSGKMPGAVVTLNPYVAAAKFVLSKKAPEKDVKNTARQIGSEIAKYVKQRGLMPDKKR